MALASPRSSLLSFLPLPSSRINVKEMLKVEKPNSRGPSLSGGSAHHLPFPHHRFTFYSSEFSKRTIQFCIFSVPYLLELSIKNIANLLSCDHKSIRMFFFLCGGAGFNKTSSFKLVNSKRERKKNPLC